MSSTSTQKQQQQRRRIHQNHITHQSRNTNAYIDRDEYHQRALINNNPNYWNDDYHRSNEDFYSNDYYQHRRTYPHSSQQIRQARQAKNESHYHSKSSFSSSSNNSYHSYYDNIPPRHRLQQQQNDKQRSARLQESKTNHKSDSNKLATSSTNDEQPSKPSQSASSSSTNSDLTTNAGLTTNRKDLHAKNLAAAAIAARQQNSQPQTNLGVVQALMNSLILQQQQQQPAQSQSTVQLQYQLTNALLATMIQQRLKETVLQAQAQQIQAALPTLLAAQALAYQQGQLPTNQQPTQSILPPHLAHPGTKFNNRPLVKFSVRRPTVHPTGITTQQPSSTTILPTYQQVQEIERGISLDEAIHLKSAIDIADVDSNNSRSLETEATRISNSTIIE